MKVGFYGLLYLCEEDTFAGNISAKSFRDKIATYVNCAITLSNSLQSKGCDFTLLTNNRKAIEEIVQTEGQALQVKEIPFTITVPQEIHFYSAHFKLDAFRYLSSLGDSYVALCDLDIICINDLPHCFSNIIEQKIPMFYDISDQAIPVVGDKVIIRDLETVHGLASEGRWAGGEFISGTPEFFQALIQAIDSIYDNYINNIPNLNHVGDETATSAALEMLRKRGTYIADAGTLGIVGRFWRVETVHPQKSFDYFQRCFLLHLPSDKEFLARMVTDKSMELSEFTTVYANYVKAWNSSPAKFKRSIRRLAKSLM